MHLKNRERERERESKIPILMEVTRSPQALRRSPILLAVTPLPRPLTTPPVTNTYFIFALLSSFHKNPNSDGNKQQPTIKKFLKAQLKKTRAPEALVIANQLRPSSSFFSQNQRMFATM
jgi:hypothetical protein